MTQILILLEIFFTIVIGIYFMNALKTQTTNKVSINKGNKKEEDLINELRNIHLTEPLTEKSRPNSFDEIIGQENGIRALKAAICSPNPQHVIIYGPPGTGKTAAARLVLEFAKNNDKCPFNEKSKFIEVDATTIRCDDRGIADPLIGSVHDPIYQGAGSLGMSGVPQPKPGAVTKAHGGILFIDEIGELNPTEMNKLLKVLEDRKVFLESSYYNGIESNVPSYIKDIFENGLPADFRLISATTRSPEEITPALRSRCVEIFFRSLMPEEIKIIAKNAVDKIGFFMGEKECELISKYCTNGRETINLIQLASGLALNKNKKEISIQDIEWVIENGQYTPNVQKKIAPNPRIGYVNGLAVYGANIGMMMEIEATAKHISLRQGTINVTGIVEKEEIKSSNKKMIRKSTAWCSIKNVLTIMKEFYNIDYTQYDIHINFPGGVPVDGPSAGISIATAVYSAIKEVSVNNKVAMTGEISIHGDVKPVGGVNAKIRAAIRAGANKVIIPKDNWRETYKTIKNAEIIPVSNIKEVIENSILDKEYVSNTNNIKPNSVDVLSAESINK